MQRYFFHVRDGRNVRRDNRGVELERLEEAPQEITATIDLLGEAGEDLSRYVVEVVSDDGSTAHIPVRDTLPVGSQKQRAGVEFIPENDNCRGD